MKFLIILILSILAAPTFAQGSAIEKACIGESCFEKVIGSKQEEEAKAKYMDLVKLIDNDPMKVFYIAEDFLGKSKDPGRSIEKYFGWISSRSLTYVIVGEDYCAVLLNKTDNDRYVLYFNNEVGKFELSYKTPQDYEVIDSLWVNGSEQINVTK